MPSLVFTFGGMRPQFFTVLEDAFVTRRFCSDIDCWNRRVGNLDNTESAPSAKLETIYDMSKFASAYHDVQSYRDMGL